MEARKKPVETVSVAELGLDESELRSTHSVSRIEIASERQAGDVVDEATGPDRIVELLAAVETVG
jgi:electron transfer flavoprotein alpha/beta subunit